MTTAFRIILRQLALLATVALAVFMLMKAAPIDPIDAYLGPAIATVGPEQRAQIAADWGLDQPAYQQFLAWAAHILRGDLGFSHAYNVPVAQVLGDRLGPSLALAGLAWLLSGALGCVLGALAALFAGRWPDRVIRLYCYVLAATPTFWLAMIMLMVFAVTLGWAPVCCAGPIGVPPDQVSFAARVHHLMLPLVVLTLFGVAQIALHTRVKLIEVLQSDYVALTRTQGAGALDILLHHGARNAALPAVTAMLASVGEVMGGAILAEQVFAWPGLGRATVAAGMKGDVPLLLAIALLTALVVAAATGLANILYTRIDPRMAAR
ncbi:peptide/nickel transport system permease protein [Ketogulonicigenium robustum]|uniref:Peptide/nickel transport system permease protein n=1 Tax=Ketogulonicigenium robustum TaxID=92947 RepID=A0A1W6NYZ5_9RHOB|nr:ABC transporter permease [Ketogulonicigenium robustum]ARO14476.1 peptide/nickel transport system permease protein [Ketogulonicigenium robustum]